MARDNPVYDGMIYYGFGFDGSSFYNSLYSYDPAEDTWSSGLGSFALGGRDGIACGFLEDRLYCIGGRNVDPNPYGLDRNEYYSVSGGSGTMMLTSWPALVSP